MLDQFCLINMNARLYDPGLGQFLQADSMVPNPYSFHGYMRYSYLQNGPLNGTDPTGHWGEETTTQIYLIGGVESITVTADRIPEACGFGAGELELGNRGTGFESGLGSGGGGSEDIPIVVVRHAPWQPPTYNTLLPPILVPPLPMPNFYFEPQGPEPDHCQALMRLGNNTRMAAYSLSTASTGAIGVGGAMGFRGIPQGAFVAAGGAVGITVGGFYDLLGAGLQSAASENPASSTEAFLEVASDLVVDTAAGSPYSELYDFARGLETVLNGPALQQCH